MPTPQEILQALSQDGTPPPGLSRSEYIPTGNQALDKLISGSRDTCPGYPVGRLVQIYGPTMSGKTTLALKAAAEVAKFGGRTLWIDYNSDFTPDQATHWGVPFKDPLRFSLYAPEYIEEGVELIAQAIRDGVDLLVLDGASAAVSRDLDPEQNITSVQSTWANLLPTVTPLLSRSGVCMLALQGVKQELPRQTIAQLPNPRGQVWKYYPSLRLAVLREGNGVRVRVQKSKISDATGQEAVILLNDPVDNHA